MFGRVLEGCWECFRGILDVQTPCEINVVGNRKEMRRLTEAR